MMQRVRRFGHFVDLKFVAAVAMVAALPMLVLYLY